MPPIPQIEWTFQLRFLVALALGFLIGLERESTKVEHDRLPVGGIRTLPLISMYGFGCAWLYQIGAVAMFPVGLASIIALTTVGYFAKTKEGRFGATSEVSVLITFLIGAMSLLVDVWIAMAIGVIATMLLSEKAKLETYVESLDRVGFLATLRFLLVTVIILPVLPNQEYTQFKLNPTRIWEIVIMVSTIGFVGYLLSKKFGHSMGLWLSGLLGGIVSSTAVSISAGRIARKSPERSSSALQASTLGSSVMYIRILILLWAVNPTIVNYLWWKLLILAAVGIVLSLRLPGGNRGSNGSEVPDLHNPFEIMPAVWFAALFVILSVITSIVKQSAGDTGVFALSAVVGVTDIDPFILSLAQRSTDGLRIAASAIIIAMLSNTIAKGVYFSVLAPAVRKGTVARYGIWALAHIPLVLIP
ncbi:MAG: hypothetical protein COS95_02675 [Ignavibacteriales bacterium CG07_land_8_20_14_0_80_59_12]|nr:MAG: hypothetical protein COS95_02675 [Ignavibacteriales bacterium CG07_land_8_20_14_0_80_59_12]